MKALPIRVWDKKRRVMTYLPSLMPMLLPSGEVFGVFATLAQMPPTALAKAGEPTIVEYNPLDYVVMHCTGKRDVNRELLYDGDIIEGDMDVSGGVEGMPMMLVKRRGIMGWNQDTSAFTVFVTTNDPEGTGFMFHYAQARKLGNVWENPELLKNGRPIEPEAPVPSPVPMMRSKCCGAGVEERGEGITACYGCLKCGKQCETS